jgi:hypothetical protein
MKPLVFSRNSLGLWNILTGLAALQAVVAAVLHQANFVFAHAEIAVLLALAFFFHQFAGGA